MIGVSSETVLRWTRRGELIAIRLPGGALRYREGDIEAWLDSRATSGPGALTTRPTPPLANATGTSTMAALTTPAPTSAIEDQEN